MSSTLVVIRDLIYAAAVSKWAPDMAEAVVAGVMGDVVWNLQTWPLELVGWPAHNTHRQDIVLDQYIDPFGGPYMDARNILPGNERYPDRWNSDPYVVDNGDGMVEWDATSWLMPYWQARAHGFLAPATAGSHV